MNTSPASPMRPPSGQRAGRRLGAGCALLLLLFAAAAGAQTAYEGYYRYIGEYPADADPGYQDDIQGVTTDGTYWYITQAGGPEDPGDEENALWRIPVSQDLGEDLSPGGAISRVLIDDTALGDQGFWHMGDLSWYPHEGNAYLVMGVEGGTSGCGMVLAIFDAVTLQYIDRIPVCQWMDHAPWCAVDSQGFLYSSNYDTTPGGDPVSIEKFQVDWDLLDSQQTLSWEHVATIELLDENRNPVSAERVQGGAVSPADELMFLTVWGPETDPCVVQNGGGIWVFHMHGESAWRRVKRSTNGSGVFNYQYDPCETDWGYPTPEEPEGLTIWDFDLTPAPGIRGQLHVQMLDNDVGEDDIYFKHYTNKIHVNPFDIFAFPTVTQGADFAWDGAVLHIYGTSYPESLTISKRVRLMRHGGPGPVSIGD